MPDDFARALGRLLSDPGLRKIFRSDPRKAAEDLGLDGNDREAMAHLDAEDLNRQATTLIEKRFHEVGKRMPRTFERLGKAAGRHFFAFTTRPWPSDPHRHLKDALAFGEYLMERGVPGVSRWELGQIRFELEGRKWAIRWVPDAPISGRARGGLQILWRRAGGGCRSAAIGIGIPARGSR